MALKQVIAVTEIVVTVEPGRRATKDEPGRKPVTKTIPAGTWFKPQSEEQDRELRASGAIRDPQKDERMMNYADLPVVQPAGDPSAALIGDGEEVETEVEAEAPAKPAGKKPGKKPAKANDDII